MGLPFFPVIVLTYLSALIICNPEKDASLPPIANDTGAPYYIDTTLTASTHITQVPSRYRL